ncbi:MAG: hypothetical protein L0Z50_25575 [Verrucomicrobiales bacterium]|nr:hypothetical protein [Verrucomicrobiales bacterium]
MVSVLHALKHREGLLTAAFSDDGKGIVTTSFDAFASLWEVDSGRELARFSGGFVGVWETAISPDKARVALISNEKELSVRDPANEQPMVNFPIGAGESFGGNDLWTSTRETVFDNWSPPVNLGPTINTISNDAQAKLSSDGRVLFFVSNRPGGYGGLDVYVTTREKIE